jgi:hypothetical protein
LYACYDTNFHLEDGDTIFLWNVGNTSHCHIVQKPQNETIINPIMTELTPSVQCCLTRFFYWGFCFLNHALRLYMCEKPTNTPIIHSVYQLCMVAPTCFSITFPCSGSVPGAHSQYSIDCSSIEHLSEGTSNVP